ncbi:M56 family metallopeptidase [Pirellulaceae bacterium SH449]
MNSLQEVVVTWLEFVFASTLVLLFASWMTHRLREPVDRVSWISFSLVTALLAPIVLLAFYTPNLNLGIIPIPKEPTLVASVTTDPSSVSQLELVNPIERKSAEQKERLALSSHHELLEETPTGRPVVSAQTAVEESEWAEQSETMPIGLATNPNHNPDAARDFITEVRERAQLVSSVWDLAAFCLIGVYSVVFIWIVLQWCIGALYLRKLILRAKPASPEIQETWQDVSRDGRAPIRLLITDEFSTPVAFWVWKPVVVLPESLANGPYSTLKFCLLHEWAHFQRGDLLRWQWANALQFVFWFHPLYWSLRKELRVNQDLIADHYAAGKNNDPEDRFAYAELLVSIAKSAMPPKLEGGVAFCDSSSQLARRINALLASSHGLRRKSTTSFCLIASLSLLLVACIAGSVRLGSAYAIPINVPDAEAAVLADDEPQQNDSDPLRIVRGQVVNENGMPISNAKLWLPTNMPPRRTIEITADSNGRFELKCPEEWIESRDFYMGLYAWVFAPGYSIETVPVFKYMIQESSDESTIALVPEEQVRIKVMSHLGMPCRDAKVKLSLYTLGQNAHSIPEEIVNALIGTTNEEGIVTLSAIQANRLFAVEVESDDSGRQIFRMDNDNANAPDTSVTTMTLKPSGGLKGKLIADQPEWVQNVKIYFRSDEMNTVRDPRGVAEVTTNELGEFHVPKIISQSSLRVTVMIDPQLPVRPRIPMSLSVQEGETYEFNIPLVHAPMVIGKVVTKAEGAPVADAQISLYYGGPYVSVSSGLGTQSERVVTDERGEFRGRVLPGNMTVHFFSLPNRLVRLRPRLETAYAIPSDVEEFTLPTFEVLGSKELTGILLGTDGQPAKETKVFASHEMSTYAQEDTDSQGRFQLWVPEGLDFTFEAIGAWGRIPVQIVQADPLVLQIVDTESDLPDPKEEEAKRALLPDVTLSGRVLFYDKPLPNTKVIATRNASVYFEDINKIRGPVPKFAPIETQTDSDGRYRIVGLKAGDRYTMEIRPEIAATDPHSNLKKGHIQKIPQDATGDVELTDVKLIALNQTIAGKVVDLAGKPIQGVTISVELRKDKTLSLSSSSTYSTGARSDANGLFRIAMLPDALLSLTAHLPSSTRVDPRFPAKIDIAMNQQDIRIVLDP